MKLHHAVIALLSICTLSGCQGVSKASLDSSVIEAPIEIESNIRWETHARAVTSVWLVKKGVYTSVGRNSRGVFYLGPAPCFFEGHVKIGEMPRGWNNACGIFVPKQPGQSPRLFVLADSGVSHGSFATDGTPLINDKQTAWKAAPLPLDGGIVINEMLRLQKGRYIFVANQPPDDLWQKFLR